MAITILERLQDVEPRGRKIFSPNPSLKVIYDLVQKHMAEIEEARERGYSWPKVDRACRESWQEYGNAASSIMWWKSPKLIEYCYRALKRKSAAVRQLPRKEKPLSLEVQITKR